MSRIFRFVAQWPWLTLLGVLVVTVVAAWPLVDYERLRLRPLDGRHVDGRPAARGAPRTGRSTTTCARRSAATRRWSSRVSTDDVFTHDSLARIQRIVDRDRPARRRAPRGGDHERRQRAGHRGRDRHPPVREGDPDRSRGARRAAPAGARESALRGEPGLDGRKTAAIVVQFLNFSDKRVHRQGHRRRRSTRSRARRPGPRRCGSPAART